MPPDPPSISMLCLLVVLHTVFLVEASYIVWPDHPKIASYAPDSVSKLCYVCVIRMCKHSNLFPMAKTSAKELFEYYNQGLLVCLPMKDITFLEVLKRRNLLPDDVRSSLVQMDKTTERSSYFLEKIIKTGFDDGSDSHFTNLLAAMIESNYENVKDLACHRDSKQVRCGFK